MRCSCTRPSTRWSCGGDATPNPAAALETVVTLTGDAVSFDPGAVEAALADRDLLTPVPRKATKGGPLAKNIARLTNAVIEHLRAARDHAYATRDMTGTPKLLERPTQQHFAALLKLPEYTVSRCFSHRDARELNRYWDLALDLGGILSFSGPVGAKSDAT